MAKILPDGIKVIKPSDVLRKFPVRSCANFIDILKYIDQNTKYVVSGYVRKLCSSNIDIPLITHLTTMYFHEGEFFEIYGYKMKLNDECDTVTMDATSVDDIYLTVYGHVRINVNIAYNVNILEF